MKGAGIAAFAATLMLVAAVAPAAAQEIGECVVRLNVVTGVKIGLYSATRIRGSVPYLDSRGRSRSLRVNVRPRSVEENEFGIVNGTIAIVLNPGPGNCNFTDTAINRKDPQYSKLRGALLTVLVRTVATNPTFGVTIGDFSGTDIRPRGFSTNFTFGSGLKLSTRGSLSFKGFSRAFKPEVEFVSGVGSVITDFTKRAGGVDVTNRVGFSAIQLNTLGTASRVSTCSLRLGRTRGGPALFTLRCSSFNFRFINAETKIGVARLNGTTEVDLAFKQRTGRGAARFEATGRLDSAAPYLG